MVFFNEDRLNRCCCWGDCSMQCGVVTASAFLICSSTALLVWSWATLPHDIGQYFLVGWMLATVVFAALSIWGLQAKQAWPCWVVTMIVALTAAGFVAGLIIFGQEATAECTTRNTGDSFNQPTKYLDKVSAACLSNKSSAPGFLFACGVALIVLGWCMHIYTKAIAFIKAQRRGVPQVPIATIWMPNAAYATSDGLPDYQRHLDLE